MFLGPYSPERIVVWLGIGSRAPGNRGRGTDVWAYEKNYIRIYHKVRTRCRTHRGVSVASARFECG